MAYTTHAYLITALTNLHAGSGDNDYGTIDKHIQRDPTDALPIINGSSLKGALREYFEEELDLKAKSIIIFGDRPQNGNDESGQQGAYRFFAANLLSMPVRSTYLPYYNATSVEVVDRFKTMCKLLNVAITDDSHLLATDTPRIFNIPANELVLLEGVKAEKILDTTKLGDGLKTLIGDNPAIYCKEKFKDLVQSLPVIARNQLDNGQSENLWYEEVMPRESRFYFFVQVPENTDELNFEADFSSHLDNKVVQIGANATVGYGYCLITKINPK
jgi:CRISPR-associated protein Cmr4